MKKIGLDTNIFMSIFLEEKDRLEPCRTILQLISDGVLEGVVSVVSLVEVATLFCQKGEEQKSKKAVALINSLSNIAIVNLTPDMALNIAGIKVSERLSIADASILSAAIELSAEVFLTYDNDFAKVKIIKCITPEKYLNEL